MTRIHHGTEGVEVHFPGWEAIMTGRSHAHIPTRAIVSALAEPGWTSEILGARSGLAVSGYRKLGTFTHPLGARRLVSMVRGVPLLRLRTIRSETGFDEVLLSTRDAERIAAEFPGSLAQ